MSLVTPGFGPKRTYDGRPQQADPTFMTPFRHQQFGRKMQRRPGRLLEWFLPERLPCANVRGAIEKARLGFAEVSSARRGISARDVLLRRKVQFYSSRAGLVSAMIDRLAAIET